jgi:hypothetical protein
MRFNPNTRLGSLLIAIPSAAAVCAHFHMTIRGNEEKSLGQLCTDCGITFESFLQTLDNLDWSEEYPPMQLSSAASAWKV